ncbi:hypothetical protein QQF64_017703 [Cirrhinus molitorella]|uniref:exo-alpha-sialidase n=1 Tax=Cirrhinus molitorella TaxID=172907 RepID=A0ABR3LJE0_9TELE
MRKGTWKDDKNKVEWDSSYKELEDSLQGYRCMNPCTVYDRTSKTLFLFFICVPNGVSEAYQIKTKKNQARLCYKTSKDAGKNWGPLIDLTSIICKKKKNWATFAVGPGHGIQMKCGRLIIPAYAYYFDCTITKPTSRAFTFYREQTENTWQVGEFIDDDETKNPSNECQMAEIIDGSGHSTLYCNARSTSGHRVEALSSSRGEAFDKPSTFHMLNETSKGCQGSVLKIQNSDNSTWLLYSHPTDENEKKNLGIHVNKTPLDLKQWNLKAIINNGPSGYSDLAECAKTEYIACLMERGDKKEIEEITFQFVKIKDEHQSS